LLPSPLSILVSLFKLIILKAVVINRMILHKTRTPMGPKKYAKTAISAEINKENNID
jgi:hypothetical protein